jgi:hypothetical protein
MKLKSEERVTCGGGEKSIQNVSLESLKGRHYLIDLDVHGRMILKWGLK